MLIYQNNNFSMTLERVADVAFTFKTLKEIFIILIIMKKEKKLEYKYILLIN